MKLRPKKRVDEPSADSSSRPEQEPSSSSSWTHGQELLGKVVVGIVWAAVLSGPIALGMMAFSPQTARVVAAPAEGEAPLTAAEQEAGPYAASFVGAWLTATKDKHDALSRFVNTDSLSLGETGWKYRDLAVASIARDSAGIVSVRIAVNVQELDYEKDEAGEETWPRRYFQVPVQVDGDALGILGLPTPVSTPSALQNRVSTSYKDELSSSHPAAETVEAFLNAYLAGSGELSRYVSPGADIQPLDDTSYVAVSVESVVAVEEPSQNPADGETAQVYVSATVVNATQMSLRTEYALTLAARDGRWEISAINTVPAHKQSTQSTAPSSPGATQEGNSHD